MSTWVEGRVYDYYGTPVRCVRRFFVGPLEHVELEHADARIAVGAEPTPLQRCVRTARALAPCVVPRVTDTLGGVCRPDACHHDWYAAVRADAGPNAGRVCCTSCGAALAAESADKDRS